MDAIVKLPLDVGQLGVSTAAQATVQARHEGVDGCLHDVDQFAREETEGRTERACEGAEIEHVL